MNDHRLGMSEVDKEKAVIGTEPHEKQRNHLVLEHIYTLTKRLSVKGNRVGGAKDGYYNPQEKTIPPSALHHEAARNDRNA